MAGAQAVTLTIVDWSGEHESVQKRSTKLRLERGERGTRLSSVCESSCVLER